MGRHRRKQKELYPQQFDSMVRADNWKSDYVRTNSIRSGHSLEHQIKVMKKLSFVLPTSESQEINIQDTGIDSPEEKSVVLFRDFNLLESSRDNILGTSI